MIGVPNGSEGSGSDSAACDEDACPACAAKAGDDVGEAGAVDIAHFVRVLALFPFRQRNGAESAIRVGELGDVFEVCRGRGPVRRVGNAAASSEHAVGVAGVRDDGCGEGVGEGVGGASGEGAGGDCGWIREGGGQRRWWSEVGVAEIGSAHFAFGGSVVSSIAEAVARPHGASEHASNDTLLQWCDGAGVQ